MKIGNKLKNLRVAKGYSQSQVAQLLDCSKSSISMYENDRREPSLDMLVKLLRLYEATADSLLLSGE
ncbi:MAG: helix-turn-helix transcriptional regulator [Tissierellia bacterium]|nr:helix-turn-helix transcriptional regulator [Tissierellia bacterium]